MNSQCFAFSFRCITLPNKTCQLNKSYIWLFSATRLGERFDCKRRSMPYWFNLWWLLWILSCPKMPYEEVEEERDTIKCVKKCCFLTRDFISWCFFSFCHEIVHAFVLEFKSLMQWCENVVWKHISYLWLCLGGLWNRVVAGHSCWFFYFSITWF